MSLHDQDWLDKQERNNRFLICRITQLENEIAGCYGTLAANSINLLDMKAAQEYLDKYRSCNPQNESLQFVQHAYDSVDRAIASGVLSRDLPFPTVPAPDAETQILAAGSKAKCCQLADQNHRNSDQWSHIDCLLESKQSLMKATFTYAISYDSWDYLLRHQIRIVDASYHSLYEGQFVTFDECLQAFKTFVETLETE